MELNQLRYFLVLAETEHMTRASQLLHMAQPALSRSLRSLEEELGLPLFDRVGKSLVLNDNGKLLRQRAASALGELDSAWEELRGAREEAESRVSIAMQAASMLLPDIIRGFRAVHPEISLQIIQQPIPGGRPPDITIFSTRAPAGNGLRTLLLEEEILLAMPADNPLSGRESIPLSLVADQPFLSLYKGMDLRELTDRYCESAGFTPRTVLESDNPATFRELIALGVGLSFLPSVTWRGIGGDGKIRLARISDPICTRTLSLFWAGPRRATRSARLLHKYLLQFFHTL